MVGRQWTKREVRWVGPESDSALKSHQKLKEGSDMSLFRLQNGHSHYSFGNEYQTRMGRNGNREMG